MSALATVLATAAVLAGVVVLITVLRVHAAIALFAGAVVLGPATGMGAAKTIETIGDGFGKIMVDVGLLIAFGVLIGPLLAEIGVLQRLVEKMLRAVAPKRVPYVLVGSLAALAPAIFTDVMLVLTAPLVRGIAGRGARRGNLPQLGAAMVIGLEQGLALVVPGAGALLLIGMLHVPVWQMFVYGLVVALIAGPLAVFVFGRLVQWGLWRPERDEEPPVPAEAAVESTSDAEADPAAGPVDAPRRWDGSLWLGLSPIIVVIVLVGAGAVAQAAGVKNAVLGFVGEPTFAMFAGLVVAYVLARRIRGAARCEAVLESGLRQAGPILVLTGVGGALASVVSGSGLSSLLGGLVQAGAVNAVLPIVLSWGVAALMRVITGSAVSGAVLVAGILGPLAGQLGIDVVFIALAVGAGGTFGLHVNCNFFWMFKSLMGVTTSGALRTCTLGASIGSVLCLPLIVLLSVLT